LAQQRHSACAAILAHAVSDAGLGRAAGGRVEQLLVRCSVV
jgi:hypothetical protein